MKITVFDLTFHAEVDILSRPRPATYWEPAEDLEFEVTALFHNGVDVSFMLGSDTLREEIENAIGEALEVEARSDYEDYQRERFDARMENLL